MTEKEMKKRNIKITICVCIILNVIEIIAGSPYTGLSEIRSRMMKEYLEIRDPENVQLIGYSIGTRNSYQRTANRVVKIEEPVEKVYEYYESELNRNGWMLKKQVSNLEGYYEKEEFEVHMRPYNTEGVIDFLVWMKVKDGVEL